MSRHVRRGRRRRLRSATLIRSVLAFGLVLGVGATITDAAWTDQEYAAGTFKTGTFNIEGSVDGTNFSQNPTANGPALGFNATAMYPGAAVAAQWTVRTVTGSIGGKATLALTTPAPAGGGSLLSDLQVRIYWNTTSGCTTTSTGPTANYLVGTTTTWGLLTTAPATTAMTLGAATASAPGAPIYLCFQVQLATAAANADQGQTATANWVVTGTNP